MENKRPIPNKAKTDLRKAFFFSLIDLQPKVPKRHNVITPKGLEPGNKKTGLYGRYFERVFVWNLPIKVTCPGESDWCKKHCYNADYRQEVYPIDLWCENWWLKTGGGHLKDQIFLRRKYYRNLRFTMVRESQSDYIQAVISTHLIISPCGLICAQKIKTLCFGVTQDRG